MFKMALKHKDLKIIMGTDAGAGAHGQNAREIVYRVQVGVQAAMDHCCRYIAQCFGPRPAGPNRLVHA